MVTIKLSQYFTYHLVRLSETQINEIEEARTKATQFVQAGTLMVPVVKFYVENDIMNSPEIAFGDFFDGKGFEVSYGILPRNEYDVKRKKYRIIHLTYPVFAKSQGINISKEDTNFIPELPVISINDFNKLANETFKFEPLDYNLPNVNASHMIKFFDLKKLSANFPLELWETALPVHYLFNELNSNRKWKNPTSEEEILCDVVRFYDIDNDNIIYYADVFEHTPTGFFSDDRRDFLFLEVDEKDIVYRYENEE